MKAKVALAVAIALAILAAVGIRAYLNKERERIGGERKVVEILVAAQRIPAGSLVKATMLKPVEVDQASITAGHYAFRELDAILNRRIMKNVAQDEAILRDHFFTPSRRARPAEDEPLGLRQITIPVDKVRGCAGRLVPHTIVDVLCTLRRRDAKGNIQQETMTVLTNVTVVATDLHVDPTDTFLSAKHRRELASYSTVTLRASPLEANILAFLADQGKIHLVIRGPADETDLDPAKIDPVRLDNLNDLIKTAAQERARRHAEALKRAEALRRGGPADGG